MNKKRILEIGLSIIISYIFFYNVTSEFISYFYMGSIGLEVPLYLLILSGQTLMIYVITKYCFEKKISQFNIKLLWCVYLLTMLLLLFGRPGIGRQINLDLTEFFNGNLMNLFQIALNFILFFPLGFLLRKFNKKTAVLFAAGLVIGIELLQYITARGIFDICDIVTDTFAILISYLWFHNHKNSCQANNI